MSIPFKVLTLSAIPTLFSCYMTVPLDGLSRNTTAPPLNVAYWLNSIRPIEIDSLGENHTLIEFWSKDCPPCVRSIEKMKALKKEYSEKLQLITVHVNLKKGAQQDIESITHFVQDHGIEYPVGIDSGGELWDHYNFGALPHGVIIDEQKKVVWSGNLLVWNVEKALFSTLGRRNQDIDAFNGESASESASLPASKSINNLDSNCTGGVCRIQLN